MHPKGPPTNNVTAIVQKKQNECCKDDIDQGFSADESWQAYKASSLHASKAKIILDSPPSAPGLETRPSLGKRNGLSTIGSHQQQLLCCDDPLHKLICVNCAGVPTVV